MRTIIVTDERNLADVSPVAREAIRAANPHLDLDRLRPGAVVVLPDHPDIAAGEPAPGHAAAGIADVDGMVAAARTVLSRGAAAGERRHAELRKALGGRELVHAAAADPELREDLRRVAEAVAEDQRLAAEWHATMAAALDHLHTMTAR